MNKLSKKQSTIIIAVGVGVALTIIAVLALSTVQKQQQEIQLPKQQVSEQPESNLTIPQSNISSSNTSNINNNTISLKQPELVAPDTVINMTNTTDEDKRQENESEEDIMRGHLDEDLQERQAQLN